MHWGLWEFFNGQKEVHQIKPPSWAFFLHVCSMTECIDGPKPIIIPSLREQRRAFLVAIQQRQSLSPFFVRRGERPVRCCHRHFHHLVPLGCRVESLWSHLSPFASHPKQPIESAPISIEITKHKTPKTSSH